MNCVLKADFCILPEIRLPLYFSGQMRKLSCFRVLSVLTFTELMSLNEVL